MDHDEINYLEFIEDIINDINHTLLSTLDTTITNDIYSVEHDSTDNTITVMFEEYIPNQKDTIEFIVEELKQGINRYIIGESITVILVKHTQFEDILAELAQFTLEGEE